jgi:hypothetical protein
MADVVSTRSPVVVEATMRQTLDVPGDDAPPRESTHI